MNAAASPAWMTARGHIVEASAGTGKTTRLVQEFVNAVRAGADVRRTLALTFTHAAAGDLKLRIRQKLDDAVTATTGMTRDRIRKGIEHLEQAYIGTIHGFCAHCLRQRPVEAALDPAFIELAEMESAALFAKVFERWLETRLAQGSPTLNRAFSRLAYRDDKNQDAVRFCQEISVSTSGNKAVVPIAVEGVSLEPEFGHLLVGNLDPRRIGIRV
jgi:ATP-dependent helicase/nuclease subunit A